MPKNIHTQDSSQQRASRLLLAMGVIVLVGALAYFVLTLVVNRRTPAAPDTHYTADNGIVLDYESAVWPVCEMTEDDTLGHALKLASGTDILSSLNGLGEPDVLLVGGIFGVLGFLIHYCIGLLPVIGSAGPATTDLPGITVFILAVVTRLAFGKTGLTGKYTGSGKREWFATGKGFVYNVVLGGGIGIVVSFIAAFLYENEFTAAFSIFPIVCFGFAAITLIFTQTGFATPATHHIFLPSGLAAVAGITAWGPAGALLGVLFGILGSLLGDLVGKSLNSHCDTHIDPPATTIFILTIVINAVSSVINA